MTRYRYCKDNSKIVDALSSTNWTGEIFISITGFTGSELERVQYAIDTQFSIPADLKCFDI